MKVTISVEDVLKVQFKGDLSVIDDPIMRVLEDDFSDGSGTNTSTGTGTSTDSAFTETSPFID